VVRHKPIVVTGAGVVCAIGNCKGQVAEALRSCRSGISTVEYLDTSHKEFPVGEVRMTNTEMRAAAGIAPGEVANRSSLMAVIAAGEALAQAGLACIPEGVRVGLVTGTTVGGMDMSERHYRSFKDSDEHAAYIATHDCGSTNELIADRFPGLEMVTTVSTACSSAANAVMLGANLIDAGMADVMVVGGTECLTRFHLNGFKSLMILDREPCRPFDISRAGLNLGEGAAYLVIETEESARRRGVPVVCRLSGWGNACDAFHQTATSADGEGAYLSMKAALESAGLQPSDIDYINAHGTSTPNNDESEAVAVERLFAGCMPAISSTKSYTGHTTSASGAIESVICLLALEGGFMPANLNLTLTLPQPLDRGIRPVMPDAAGNAPSANLKNILCNSFGFGGNDSSLIFSRFDD